MSQANVNTYGQQKNNTPHQLSLLQMVKLLMRRITGAGGSRLETSSFTNKNYYSFIVQEDTTISVLTGGPPPIINKNYLTELNISGATLKQGALFTIPVGEVIVAGTISGSIIGYKQ